MSDKYPGLTDDERHELTAFLLETGKRLAGAMSDTTRVNTAMSCVSRAQKIIGQFCGGDETDRKNRDELLRLELRLDDQWRRRTL